jgi:hypothetical protein
MQNPMLLGLISALGVAIYVAAVSALMTNAEKLFGRMDNVLSGAVFLLVFTVSAFVVGSLLIAKPVMLYIDGKKKDAVKLLLWSLFYLVLVTIIGIGILAIIK